MNPPQLFRGLFLDFLSFCCVARFSISGLSADGGRSAHVQRSASGFFFILALGASFVGAATARRAY